MRNEQLREAEFATYAKEALLRRDPRSDDWSACRNVRMVDWLRPQPLVSSKAPPTPGAGC